MSETDVKKILLVGATIGLIACGGSTTTSNTSQQSTNGNNDVSIESDTNELALNERVVEIEDPIEENFEQINTTVNATVDLEVSEEFELQSMTSLDVLIDIPSLYGKRAYVNICKPFSDGRTNYNDCLIRSPIENGQWLASLSVPNDVDLLKLEIWQYSISEEPIVHVWENQNTGMQWRIES